MRNHFLRDALRLIDPVQQRKGLGIVLLLALSSLLDFFSLAFFLPLIFVLVDPEAAQRNHLLQQVITLTGLTSITSFAIAFTIGVFLFIVLKMSIINWITGKKALFAYTICNNLATRAVNRYLNLSYTEYTHTRLSNEVNLISSLPLLFANNIILPAGTFLSEGLVFLLLLTGVAIYDWKVFVFLFVILVPAYLVYRLRRKKIKAIGASLRNNYPYLLRYTIQLTEALPDIRSFGKEWFFKKRFQQASHNLGKTYTTDHVANTETPRMTEVVAALCLCMMIIYALLNHENQKETLLLLALYAGVSFRIIPSVNRILASVHQMRVYEYVVHELIPVIHHSAGESSVTESAATFKDQITIRNLTFGYPGHSTVLKQVNLTIRKGEKIALTGKSGSGKTTLLLLLLRFIQEQEGEILIDGQIPTDWTSWRKLVGYVPQNPFILDGSIVENIAFGVPEEQINHDKVNTLVREMELEGWVHYLPEGIQTRIGEKGAKISGGQRQRIAIARALYHDAEILLLDEVTNQLDPETEKEVIGTLLKLSDQNKTIIMITHHPDLLRKFDAVYELTDGSLGK